MKMVCIILPDELSSFIAEFGKLKNKVDEIEGCEADVELRITFKDGHATKIRARVEAPQINRETAGYYEKFRFPFYIEA